MTPTERRLPVFYVNLASRPDRRAFMEDQFARLGIEAERFEAVRSDEVPDDIVRERPGSPRVRPLAPGDLACGLSHQGIWRLMVDRGLPAALILEDDALMSPALLDFLDPDLLHHYGCDLLKLETRRDNVLLGPPRGKVGSATLQELQSSHRGGAAYIISRDAAARSLASRVVNDEYVDRFLFGKRGPHLLRSTILQAVPSPVVQLDHLSHDRSSLPSYARSDLIASRAKRQGTALRSPWALLSLTLHSLDHAVRLLRLFARDPQVLRRPRQQVAFAGDPSPTALGPAAATSRCASAF